MSESRRTKLEEIQKREQLKGMLISKFRNKYGKTNEGLTNYIDNQVGQFMNANRLTETNLKELDEKIQKEKYTQDKKAAIRADRKAKDETMSKTSEVKKARP